MRRALVAGTALLALVLAAAAAMLASGPADAAAAAPRVTLIGDSVPSALAYEPRALATLRNGTTLDLQLAPCRRVAQTSCPYKDTTPPNVLELLQTLGAKLAGTTVVVAVGYNDYQQEYARNIEAALTAMSALHVERVMWLTLRAERQSYLDMNDMIRAAAARHPELSVVDWNLYSRSHPDWFQPDGLHLTFSGAFAMATLIHRQLVDLRVVSEPGPLVITAPAIARGRVGKPYRSRLTASGGTAPYRWTRAAGAMPTGLRLTPAGRLAGTPRVRGRFTLVVRVRDAAAAAATRRLVVRIA